MSVRFLSSAALPKRNLRSAARAAAAWPRRRLRPPGRVVAGRLPPSQPCPKSDGARVEQPPAAFLCDGPGRVGLVTTLRQQHKHQVAVLGLSLLTLAMLAGCAGLDDSDTQTTGKNKDPEAVLNASDNVVDAGDTVSFDAKGSSDEDGEIVSYSYSFGDGTTGEGVDDDSKVEHIYTQGGEYIVTLTVTDDGNDRAGALSDTDTVEITVNQEFPIASQAVSSDPVDVNSSTPFAVYKSADRFELDLDVTGSLLTGSSEVEIKVLDPEGDTIAQETVTVQGTDMDSIDLHGLLLDEGDHSVEVTAKSGSATVEGRLKVFYGAEEL